MLVASVLQDGRVAPFVPSEGVGRFELHRFECNEGVLQ